MFQLTALPAGPRVNSARVPGARSVSVEDYVLAGSRLVSAEQVGVANVMENSTFMRTAAYPKFPWRPRLSEGGRERSVTYDSLATLVGRPVFSEAAVQIARWTFDLAQARPLGGV